MEQEKQITLTVTLSGDEIRWFRDMLEGQKAVSLELQETYRQVGFHADVDRLERRIRKWTEIVDDLVNENTKSLEA